MKFCVPVVHKRQRVWAVSVSLHCSKANCGGQIWQLFSPFWGDVMLCLQYYVYMSDCWHTTQCIFIYLSPVSWCSSKPTCCESEGPFMPFILEIGIKGAASIWSQMVNNKDTVWLLLFLLKHYSPVGFPCSLSGSRTKTDCRLQKPHKGEQQWISLQAEAHLRSHCSSWGK